GGVPAAPNAVTENPVVTPGKGKAGKGNPPVVSSAETPRVTRPDEPRSLPVETPRTVPGSKASIEPFRREGPGGVAPGAASRGAPVAPATPVTPPHPGRPGARAAAPDVVRPTL